MAHSWVLATEDSVYGVSVVLDGSALVLDYFGPTADPIPRWVQPDRPPIMSTFADYAPIEFGALGTRNVHSSELIVEREDGSRGSRLIYADHDFTKDDLSTHLSVRFADDRGMDVVQHIRTHSTSDVVERWVEIIDTRDSGAPVRLAKAFSGALSLSAPFGVRLDYLAGAWMREYQPQTLDLKLGTFRMGSRQGLTGHLFVPTIAAQILGADGQVDTAAGTFGVSLQWSGSWAMEVEAHPNGLTRIGGGLNDEGTTFLMTPGRRVETPHLLLVHVPDGPDALARSWHRYQRETLARSATADHTPVVYNSWEATEFDVNEEHQLRLASIAADMGVEVFVIDDGWFRGRNDGDTGLGDWFVDPEAFPSGLASFATSIAEKGMRFGLWIELEAVSPNSELFRAHPDWVYSNEGLEHAMHRDQHVLDLGKPEVFDWMLGTLRGVLSEADISFLKWDMNRPLRSPGREGDPFALEWSRTHTLNYYRLLEAIRDEFPHVTVEGCAGGGGRVDNAVLGLVDTVWTSDATGPRDRLRIQDGFLRAYSPSVMSSWVTMTAGVLDRAPTSLEFRFVTAMAGVLGIGANIEEWDAEQRATAQRMISLYKELRPVIHSGEVFRHSDPQHAGYAIEYQGGAEVGGRIVVLAYDSSRERTGPDPVYELSISPPARVRLASPDPERQYVLRGDGSIHSGAVLRSVGIAVPWAIAQDADVLVFDPV